MAPHYNSNESLSLLISEYKTALLTILTLSFTSLPFVSKDFEVILLCKGNIISPREFLFRFFSSFIQALGKSQYFRKEGHPI